MLVGIRAQLRAGGRAFITLPRSCLDHSFTLSEKSFCEALVAVGLPPSGPRPSGEEERRAGGEQSTERAGGERSTETPSSSKIAFFDCVASLPDADAARRFMRMRHEARKAHRAAEGAAGKGRDKGKGKWKGKSAGSAFDVDLGG